MGSMIAGLYRHRSYILRNAWIGFIYRYPGVYLSLFWNLAQPIMMIVLYLAVFTLIFSSRLEGGGGGSKFALYLCAGYLPWVAMTECVTFGAGAFIKNAAFLKRLPVPEHVYVAKEAAVAMYSLVVSLAFLAAASILLGNFPTMNWLILPVPLILFQVFAFGMGLALGVINVFFRDVERALGIVFQGWFWLTPIVYPVNILPEPLRWIMDFNPAYPFIRSAQDIFIYNQPPAPATWYAMFFWCFASIIAGSLILGKFKREIRDAL
jgi:lipopolysaccharide transport system permease protein